MAESATYQRCSRYPSKPSQHLTLEGRYTYPTVTSRSLRSRDSITEPTNKTPGHPWVCRPLVPLQIRHQVKPTGGSLLVPAGLVLRRQGGVVPEVMREWLVVPK